MQAVDVEDSVWDNIVASIDETLMRMNFGGKLSPTHISSVEKQDDMLQVVLQSPNPTQESIYMCVDTKTNKILSAHSPNKASMSKGKGVYESPVMRSSPRTKGKEDWTSEHAPTRSSPRTKGKEIVIYEPICTISSRREKGKGIVISEPSSESDWDNSSNEIIVAESEDDSSDSSEVSLVDEDDIFDNESEDEPDALDRMYEGGRWWEPELDGSIEIMQWDLFEDKSKFLEVIRDYQIHKGWYFKQIKNEGSKYTAFCNYS